MILSLEEEFFIKTLSLTAFLQQFLFGVVFEDDLTTGISMVFKWMI